MSVDTWDNGDAYERYVGRWSRRVATQFVRWLALPHASTWLDFGCGSGALAETILSDAAPLRVVGCDQSPGYIDHAERRISDPRVHFVIASVSDLPAVEGGFDACVSGLVLNFLPSPDEDVAALGAVVRPGGTLAAYVWDYAEGMGLMRVFWDAAVSLDPAAHGLDEGLRFPLCRPDVLRRVFESAGLRDIDVLAIEVPTVFDNFDDYWKPFLGGQGPAPGYVKTLDDQRRERLCDNIRQRLPIDAAGHIRLTARAWAVRGVAG